MNATETDRHLRPDERILWRARPSLVGLLPIVAYTAAALAVILLGARLGIQEPGTIIRGTPALLLAIAGVLIETGRRYVKLRYTTFIVTDQRFYAITTFLETDTRSIPLSRATHVHVRQGITGRLLGIWSARITGYGRRERGFDIPAIRDGEGLLRELGAGMRRGANVEWLRSGD